MDPLSAAASVASLLDLANSIASYAWHAKHARKELEEVALRIQTPTLVLKTLHTQLEQASKSPADAWFQGIQSLDPATDKGSPVARLGTLLVALQDLVAPPEHWKRRTQVLRWHWDRDKVSEKFDEIQNCCVLISQVLSRDHFDLGLAIKKTVSDADVRSNEIHDNVITQLAYSQDIRDAGVKTAAKTDDIHEKVKNLELGQQQQNVLLQNQEKERTRQKKNQIAEWLSPFRFLSRQQELSQKCFPIGKRIFDSLEFVRWSQGAPWQLYLRGDAGAGKTCLTAILVDKLQARPGASGTPVLCIYLDHRDQRSHTKVSLLGSLLKQLLQKREDDTIPEDLLQVYDRASERSPTLAEVEDWLQKELCLYDRVYIVVDGLDEATEKTRKWLMTDLPDLDPERSRLSILYTTRYFEVETTHIYCSNCGTSQDALHMFWSCKECEAPTEAERFDICQKCFLQGIRCPNPAHAPPSELSDQVFCDDTKFDDEEIAGFVRHELQLEIGNKVDFDIRARKAISTTAFGRKLKNNPNLCEEIVKRVIDLADGHVIFASLCVDALKEQRSVSEIRKTLHDLVKSTDVFYDGFMNRIRETLNKIDQKAAFDTFATLSCAQRNLTLKETQILVAIDPEETEYDPDSEYDEESLLDYTKNLVSIADYQEDGITVTEARLFHSTFDIYLQENRAKLFGDPHSEIARKCLTYLQFDELTEPLGYLSAFDHLKTKYPLVTYAAQFWGDHIRLADSDNGLTDMAVTYMSDPKRVTACMQLAWCAQTRNAYVEWDLDFPKGVSNLHLCAWAGLTKCIEIICEEEEDPDVEEANFCQTPLMLACRRANVDIVKQLLKLKADPNRTDSRGRTALVEAIEHKRDEIVDILLKDGRISMNATYTIERTEHIRRTALMIAASKNHAAVIKVLLRQPNIDVNAQDPDGKTALILAADLGFGEIVQVLLDRPEMDVFATSRLREWSALTFAVASGHTETVKQLLTFKNEIMKTRNDEIANAFFTAFAYDGIEVITVLLESISDLKPISKDGQDLLHMAGYFGWANQIPELLARGLDINARGRYGLTALHEACWRGYSEIVTHFQSAGANVAIEDDFGRTPLKTAWLYGNAEIQELLMQGEGSPQEEQAKVFKEQDLPMWSLARSLKHKLLAEGIRSGRVNASEIEPLFKQTALHEALDREEPMDDSTDQMLTIKILLEETDVDVDAQNSVGCTALHHAASCGNIEAIQLLFDHDATIDVKDKWEKTPLSRAYRRDHLGAISTLIEFGAEPELASIGVQTLFFMLVEHGSAAAVRRLLISFAADPLEKDELGRTSYDIAKKRGDASIISAIQSTRTILREDALHLPETKPKANETKEDGIQGS